MEGDPGVRRAPHSCLLRLRRTPSPVSPSRGKARGEQGAAGSREEASFGCGGSSVRVSLAEGETEERV